MSDDDIALANALADAAGSIIRPLFRGDFAQDRKADASPVTEADRAAEAAMRRIIEEQRPDDGIVGEEFGSRNEGAGRQWVLDPIDGTISFMAGRPIFGTLIALVQEGWPVLGALTEWVPGFLWLCLKTAVFMFLFLWFRATFPRYRYDQIMRLGWKVFIPVTLVWLCVEAVLWIYKVGPFAA